MHVSLRHLALALSLLAASVAGSPGILNTGDLALTSGSTLNIEVVSPYLTAGVHYDQVNVTGTVDLGGADLVLIGGVGLANGSEELTIIANDASDAITGTFAGLAEGALVGVADFMAVISYAGGDGNDVTLSAVPGAATLALTGGDLILDGIASLDADNHWTIARSGGTFTITDVNGNPITTSIAGATGSGTSTITVPDTGVSGTIVFYGGGGDDYLALDLDAGFSNDVEFHGGAHNSGDTLALSGSATALHYYFVAANDGSVQVGTRTISYTGLE